MVLNNFWRLVTFEYKKILKKKSVMVTFLLALMVTVLSCVGTLIGYIYVNGEAAESKYESMIKDRAYDRALALEPIDSGLLIKTAKAYAKIPDSNQYTGTEEYERYARPYSRIYGIMRAIYNSNSDKFEFEDVQNLTKKQADDFYHARYNKLEDTLNSTTMSDKAKTKLLEMDESVKKPFILAFTDGYTRFFSIMYTVGILATFVAAICLSPIFSGEYTSGADQLILASRNGKKSLIGAKLFVGITLSASICVVLTSITYFESMLVYGFDGANAPLQLCMPLNPYPLTMGQTALIFSICILLANLLTTAITLLLSAKMKSPFGVIIIISVITIVPMFINASGTNVLQHNILSLIPSNMMGIWTVVSSMLFEFMGMMVRPYIFLPLFSTVVIVLILPFAYYSFKDHQIG